MNGLVWTLLSPGLWKAVIGSPSGMTPLEAAGCTPDYEAMERIAPAELPWELKRVTLEDTGDGWIVRFPMNDTEHVYGFGLQFMKMNQRGRNRYLRVSSDPKQDTGESHAPVPFFAADSGYGVLVNTSRIVTVYCGSTVMLDDTRLEEVKDRNAGTGWKATPLSRVIEVKLHADGAELLLFAGQSTLDVVRKYNMYCGGGTLPPRWGLGFWHRVPKLYSDKEVSEEALEFRKRGIPCDVIGLEPGWHTCSYPVSYEWSKERFPDPQSFVKEMAGNGFRINLWEHPYVAPQSALYDKLKPLSGSYSVWGGLAPDYTLPEAQAAYKAQHEQDHVSIGVSGYKLDECDGSDLTGHSWMFPAHAGFPSGHNGEQVRQLYGLLFQKMTADLYRSRNERTYGLVRASNAGASSMPYVLYSDLYDHKQFVRALCNSSFSGLLWTPEVRKASGPEDWVRRMQTVCFSPLAMLNAWGDGTKPWTYPEVEPVIRHYIKLRMRLLPYLYSSFARYRFDGTPPFRAMPLVVGQLRPIGGSVTNADRTPGSEAGFNTSDGAYGKQSDKVWDDQFMIGDSLLVAPLFAGEQSREVLLPPGVWYGFETGQRYEGGRAVRVQPGLETIPVFVRDGAVIPLMAERDHAPRRGEKTPLEVVHFGTSPGECMLYDDDGETYDYESGQHVWRKLSVQADGQGGWTGDAGEAGGLFTYDRISWTFGCTRLPASGSGS